MELILKKLRETYPIYTFEECMEPPSYISTLLPKERNILLCYKEVQRKNTTVYSQDQYSFADVETTGQPLPVPEDVDETISTFNNMTLVSTKEDLNENHGPVSDNDARSILSYCNTKLKVRVPVWVLKGLAGLKKPVLLSSHKKDGWIRQCWSEDFVVGEASLPSIDHYVASHKKEAEYITNSVAEVKCSKVVCAKRSSKSETDYFRIKLCLNWNQLVVDPPINGNTTASLVCDFSAGHGTKGTLIIWKLLELLNNYKEIIKNNPDGYAMSICLPPCEDILNCLGLPILLKEQVEAEAKEMLRRSVRCKQLELNNFKDLQELVNVHFHAQSPMADHLDKLWYYLIRWPTAKELALFLSNVVVQIKNNKMSGYYFQNIRNKSKLAKLIENGDVLTSGELIKDFVELGIQKLKCDFIKFYSALKISSFGFNESELPRLCEIVDSLEWSSGVEKWLNVLTERYCWLELLLNCQELLPSRNLLSLSDSIQKHLHLKLTLFSQLLHTPNINVCIPLNIIDIKCLVCKIRYYDEWALTLCSKNEKNEATSVFYRGLKFLFPRSIKPGTELMKLKEDDTNPNFHCVNLFCLNVYFGFTSF